jgi:hypothetical protein
MKRLVRRVSLLSALIPLLALMLSVDGYAQMWTPTGTTEPAAITKAAEKEIEARAKEAEKLRKEQLKAEEKRLKEEEKRLKKEEKARKKAEKARLKEEKKRLKEEEKARKKAEKARLKEEKKRLKEEEKARKEADKARPKEEQKRLKEEEKARKKAEKARLKEEKKRLKEEAKWRKEEEKRLKKLEKEELKAEEKIRKEGEKRKKSSVVKNPGTPEGQAAEMILKYYEFYFPIMMVYEENETCLRKGGADKANLCKKMAGVGDARITKIKTFLGAPEESAGKKRTTIAAKIQGTVVVNGKKRTVKRDEYFYLDNRKDVTEFSDAHGVFRLTFKK